MGLRFKNNKSYPIHVGNINFLQEHHHWPYDHLRSHQHYWYTPSYSAYKFQNRQLVYEGAFYKYFFHPYMQATTMFFGEFLALLVFIVMTRRDPEGYKMRMLEAKSKGK